MERLSLAAAHERGQGDVEDALERRSGELSRRLDAELKQRVAVERGDIAGGIEADDALAPGTHELGAAMKAHHEVVAEAIQEKTVLDHLRRHVHEHERCV